MKIYLVRHGETAENVARRHQREESPLNTVGKEQAAAIAKRIARLHPSHVIVSTRIRALETGQAIAAATDLIPETSELFVELCRPQNIYAIKRTHPRSLWYLWRWFFFNLGGPTCGERGETYAALRVRIAAAKAYLKTLPEDAVVIVVTHSIFMNFFVAHLNDERPVSLWRAPRVLWGIVTTKNTSIVPLGYDAGTDEFFRA